MKQWLSQRRIARTLVVILALTLLQVVAAPILIPQVATSSAQAADANEFPRGLGTVYRYLAESYTSGSTSWPEASGGTAVTISNSATKVTNTAGTLGASKSVVAVQGSYLTQVTFPTNVAYGDATNPANYTFLYVARYAPQQATGLSGSYCDDSANRITGNAGKKSRIFSSETGNWLSGFWACQVGVSYHEGWLTPITGSISEMTGANGNNWLLGTDCGYVSTSTSACNNQFRAFGSGRNKATPDSTNTSGHQVVINRGAYNAEVSDFQIAEVISYPTILQMADVIRVETYLARKYGLTLTTSSATKLGVHTASVGTSLNEPLATQPQIAIQDSNGQTITGDNSTVITATVTGLGGSLIGTTTATAIQGVATFDNLGVDGIPGTSYTITYTSNTGLTSTSETRTFTRGGRSETDTAMTFNGTNQAVEVTDTTGSPFDLTGTLTIEAWVNPSDACAGGMAVVAKLSYMIYCSQGEWAFMALSNGTTGSGVKSGIPIEINEWHHLAFTKTASSGDVLFYYDGVLVKTIASGATSMTPNNEPLQIGRWASYAYWYKGQIDEVRIYNSQRSASQVLSDMQSYGDTTDANLAAYYDFNESTGSPVYNRERGASSATDLSLTNAPTRTDVKIVDTTTLSAYTIVKFPRTYLTSVGGWRSPNGVTKASVLSVAGGGGGGARHAGGGGAGGVAYAAALTLSPSSIYQVSIGIGGFGYGQPGNGSFTGASGASTVGNDSGNGTNGSNSYFKLISASESVTAIGGGGGGGSSPAGGSSGGTNSGITYSTVGASTQYSTSYFVGYGNIGGQGYNGTACGTDWCGGGGGGAGSVGGSPTTTGTTQAGNGGAGRSFDITGTATFYAGGGGGGGSTAAIASVGGVGGGAAGGLQAQGSHGSNNTGGGGGGGGFNGSTSYRGGNGGSGVIIIRWITALKPTFTYPTNAYLNVGMTETFTTNIAIDSATAYLTRTFRWESSTTGVNGLYSLIKQGTGAANASLSWTPSDTRTSGSTYAYRVVVTDSDAAGLFIVDTSTSVWAVINLALNVTGSATISKRINLSRSETFTITLGTPTYRPLISPTIAGITLDTSTAGLAIIKISDTLTVGTYYETLTVIDSVSASVVTPLTIVVASPPTLLNTGEISSNNLVLNLDVGSSASLISDSGTVTTSLSWSDLSGNKADASTGGGVNTGAATNTTCTAPQYSSENGGSLLFTKRTHNCYYVSSYNGKNLEAGFTVEAWFKTSATLESNTGIIGQVLPATLVPITVYMGTLSGSQIVVGFYNVTPAAWSYSSCGYTPTIGAWTHFVGTFDGSNIVVYANGTQLCSTAATYTSTSYTNTRGMIIGKGNSGDSATAFAGNIATVRIYKAPLTSAQVLINYNATSSRFTAENILFLTPSKKYGQTLLDSFTATSGYGTRSVTFAVGDRAGIDWDTTTVTSQAKLTLQESLTVGAFYDTVTVTDSLGQSTYLPIAMNNTQADALRITMSAATVTTYNGSAVTVYPRATITGFKWTDTATSKTRFSSSLLLETTTVPANADTYTVRGETPTFTSGSLSNYAGVIYETSTATINKAFQKALNIFMYGGTVGSPYLIWLQGGSGTGAVSESLTGVSSLSGCSISNHFLSASEQKQGYCEVRVVKAGDQNYWSETQTVQLYFMTYINNQPTGLVGSGSGIAINGFTSFDTSAVLPPSITGLSTLSLSLSSVGTFTITGTGFNGSITVKFWRNKVVVTTSGNGTSIDIPISSISSVGATTGRIAVITSAGEAVSVDTLTITP